MDEVRDKLVELLQDCDCPYPCKAADHLIANGVTVHQWIPVTEKLPEQGQEVIVYDGGVQKPKVFAYQFWNEEYDSWARVTHWMPLPQAPSENRPVFEDDTHEHSGLVTED